MVNGMEMGVAYIISYFVLCSDLQKCISFGQWQMMIKKNNPYNFNRDFAGLWPAWALIKAASSDERALTVHAHQDMLPPGCAV